MKQIAFMAGRTAGGELRLRVEILFDVERMVGDEVHDLDDDERESLHLGFFVQHPEEIHAAGWR